MSERRKQCANKPTMSIIFPAQSTGKAAAAKSQGSRVEGKL